MFNNPTEGWLISDSQIIYAVKGYHASQLGYYVVPKYLKGNCSKIDRCPPELQFYDPKLGRRTCILPFSLVHEKYNPYTPSSTLLLEGTNLLRPYIVFLNNLSDVALIGITGSSRIGCAGQESDLDLLFFPLKNPIDTYNRLISLRHEGITSFCPLQLVKKNYNEKLRGTLPLQFYIELSRLKVLEGCIDGVPYSARILWPPSDLCQGPCYPVSSMHYRGILRRGGYHFTTPALYTLDKENMIMLSWRIRYSELPDGYYEIVGELYHDDAGNTILVPDHGGFVRPLNDKSWNIGSR
ncbi:MAG: hypothetical protein F7C32_04045 [Desulfurococcales archaeon]|nr:hypothetical protein [Desulfurococcales archaeon]